MHCQKHAGWQHQTKLYVTKEDQVAAQVNDLIRFRGRQLYWRKHQITASSIKIKESRITIQIFNLILQQTKLQIAGSTLCQH